MDVKINGNLGIQTQSEYAKKAADNARSLGETKTGRRAVLERSVSTYGRIADICYNKVQLNESDEQKDIANFKRESSMLECIDILKESVTPEDYSQLEAWGLIPDEDNPEAFVSVYERIQIELAAYCDDYDISGLNVNKEKLKTVLDSPAMANAVSKANDIASEVSVLSDDTKKFMMINGIEPTIENVYKAIHSGNFGKSTEALSDEQWNQLSGQVEEFFSINGIEINSENLNSAKWMISSELPLTVDNFDKLSALNKVDFSSKDYMDSLKENISYTIYFGGDGMNTDITGSSFDMVKVHEAVSTVKSAMDQDVDYIIKNNKKLNIENLKLRIEERKKEQASQNDKDNIEDTYTQKNKVLVEARAILTAGSLFMMQKAGISISYTEITVMIDMSHGANASYADSVFALDNYLPADDERKLLTHTIEVMSGFKSLPIGVAASIYNQTIEYTPQAVYDEGQLLAARYKLASITYEAVGTEVRSDLGDSIIKAFRNLDELLTACGIDVNDKNRRAARVLSYNSMEITPENIEAMADITTELDELTKNLTPRAAMYLIRNGINPLQTNITELNGMLADMNAKLYDGNPDERYSEYLWKLEKNKSITKEERDAYVQMYRIIEHVKRQDGRAAGAVVKADLDMTLSNLYTAVKTRQTGSIDKKIDEATGLFDGAYADDVLARYFENAVNIIQDKELHYEYMYERFKDKLDSMKDLKTMSESEFMRYISGTEGISIGTIYSVMASLDKNLYKKLSDFKDEKINDSVKRISDTWQNNNEQDIDDTTLEQELVEDYEELKNSLSSKTPADTLDGALAKTDMSYVVNFMAKQAKNRSYYIPMEINGETTMIHMTIKNGENQEKGRISVYTDTEEGKISVLMCANGQGYETLAATDSIELKSKLETLLSAGAKVVYSKRIMDGMWNETVIADDENHNDNVDFGELVRQAKSFIHNVLRKL